MKIALLAVMLAAVPMTGTMAQTYDPRVTQLEEQVRQLNGRIEELNFQLLQMQETLRKSQEDNEFRLQQLEEKRSQSVKSTDGKHASADERPMDATDEGNSSVADAGKDATGVDWAKAGSGSDKLGDPPRSLGTLEVDKDGNVNGAGASQDVAAVPQSDSPESLYSDSYQYVLAGDYKAAEAGFRAYAERYPDGPQIADATYWLGESLIGQERYPEAAEVLLNATKTYPKSGKAPDMMLKLGVSLAAMKKMEIACATYEAIGKKYPGVSSAMRERIAQEQALAGC
ncbi:tol-pal system protein YbgF [Zhengella mangrovi]|uniref:tol-pal system protein YbgF n=1 Tax=Zhengella mangrovi TaxID=1982044 RepID=UPI0013FD5DCB|nr:tol-pal system protein YbgF [Zhengella mangrovi]